MPVARSGTGYELRIEQRIVLLYKLSESCSLYVCVTDAPILTASIRFSNVIYSGKADTVSSASPQCPLLLCSPPNMITIMQTQHLSSDKTQSNMSLSLLPAELIEHIASYLVPPAFCSFRLTSSHLYTRTTHIFKNRFFTTQNLSWTCSSLKRLEEISNHTDFGIALQNLIIDATPHYSLSLWKMRRRSADAGHITPVPDDEDGSKLIRRLAHDYEKLQEEADSMAKLLNETRFDIKCLTTVFKRVMNLESIAFKYQGMEERYSKFGRRYCKATQHEMSRPFVSTMSAIAASGVQVKAVILHPQHVHGAVSVGRLESLAPSLRYFNKAFERLDTLQLNLRDWRSLDLGFELERTRAPFVVRFLAACVNVRVLELSCFSNLEEDLFGEMARACHFNKLEMCKLAMFRINRASDLFTLFAPSHGCLVDLSLSNILLADEETTWPQLFGNMAVSTNCFKVLETLELNNLFMQLNENIGRLLFKGELLESTSTHLVSRDWADWRDDIKNGKCRSVVRSSGHAWMIGATVYPFLGFRD